jgi:NADH-quinone oxidoreductase subunit G
MGPVIKKNMNRCIHCTRCIRFGAEIAGIREMVAVQRGNNTEITTIDGRPLETDYAGNYADICPTGSLTLKDFRFRKRAWMLKKAATVCEGCARGCNMEIHQDNNVIERCVPRVNMDINRWWLCDEGRFNYHYTMDPSRVVVPTVSSTKTSWNDVLDRAKQALAGKKVTVLLGTDLTLEEAKLIQDFAPKAFPGSQLFHFGTKGITSAAQDAPADGFLKRQSKTSNLHGIDGMGIKGVDSVPAGSEAVLVIRGGRAQLPNLDGVSTVVGIGVFLAEEMEEFAAVLPLTSFAEKDGTIVNFEGKKQRLRRSINPVGMSKQLSEILMLWMHSGTRTTKPGTKSGPTLDASKGVVA